MAIDRETYLQCVAGQDQAWEQMKGLRSELVTLTHMPGIPDGSGAHFSDEAIRIVRSTCTLILRTMDLKEWEGLYGDLNCPPPLPLDPHGTVE